MGKVGAARLTGRMRGTLATASALLVAVAGVVVAPPAGAASPTVVSLAFNDGLISQYRYAAPLLEQHGMDGTFYVASNWVKSNDAKYMRSYQLDELYRQGNEIGGMGKDHKNLTVTYSSDPSADLAYKRDQVCGDFQALSAWGYHPASFTYPGGATNAAAQEIVRDCGFTTGRMPGGLSATGPTYAEPIPPAQPMQLRSANIPAAPVTLQTLQNAVTAAGANGGGWLPIAFNHVCSQAAADYSTCMGTPKPIDSQVLGSFLTWLDSQEPEGITVATVGGVMGAPRQDLPQRPLVVSLTFDDGLRSQYGLREIFARHDEAGTFYINSGPVDGGEAGTMTWAQIRDLDAAGQEIGGHTRDHINMLSTETSFDFKWRQVCDDRARLIEQGFDPVSFAFPYGARNADASALVRGCGYQSARTAGTVTSNGPIYSESIPVPDPWAIRILGTTYNGPETLEALQYAVNQARAHGGGWLPTLFHQICYVGTPNYDACMAGYRPVDDRTLDDFLTWLDGMADQNVEVKTVGEVMGAAPRVAVTGPAHGSTVGTDLPELSGTAGAGTAVSVRLYQGAYSMGTPVQTLSASVSGGTWKIRPTTALPDGTYTVQAAQTVGSSTGTSVPVTFTVAAVSGPADTTAPVVTVTSPASGSSVTTSTPTVQGTAGTADGDGGSVSVRLYAGPGSDGAPAQTISATVGSDGRWSTSVEPIADGTWTVQASQTDAAGNLGNSDVVTFTVDTTQADITAPEVAVTAPSAGATVSTSTPTIEGTGGTAAGDDGQVTVAFYPSSEVQGDAVQTVRSNVGSDGSWSATPTALTDGTWTVRATQADATGNIGTSAPVTFTVSTVPADTTAPTITITSPASGTTFSSSEVTVSGSAGSEAGDADTVTLEVYAGSSTTGSPVRTATAAAASGSWSSTLSGMAAGTYTVSASQADAAGNVGRSGPVTFTMVAPLTITGISPADLGQGAGPVSVQVTGSGFDAGTTVSLSGTGITWTTTGRTATTVTLAVSVAGDAPTTARDVTVTSTNGGSATCTGCFRVTAGPKITSVSPSTISAGSTTTVAITGANLSKQVAVSVSGTGITVGTAKVLSPTRMTVVLKVAVSAPKTLRSMTVTNRNNLGTSTLLNAVTVT